MANQRALKLKSHTAEFEAKKEDLRRLRGGLQAFAIEACSRSSRRVSPVIRTLAPYRQFRLDVKVEYSFTPQFNGVEIKLIAADCVIEKESQLHLETVRLAHDNMDTIIEAVEEFCQKAGCEQELQSQFQRFLV